MSERTDPLDDLRRSVERAWAALGVSSWEQPAGVVPVDPEPAIVMALQLFGLRSRIGLELVDWSAHHGRLLLLNRLRRLAADVSDEIRHDVETLIATAGVHAPRLKWKSKAEPLEHIELNGKSSNLPATNAAARLRARATFGANARIDILYLLASAGESEDWTTSRLVAETSIAKARVYEITSDLEQAGVVELLGSHRNSQLRLRPDDAMASAARLMAPRTAIAPWRSAIVLVHSLIAATTALDQTTIASLASAQQHVAAAQAHGWRGWTTRSQPTGDPDHVRSELRTWLAQAASTLGYALAYGPPVGVVEVTASADGRANLAYFSGKAKPDGDPDLTWHLERSGSITTTRSTDLGSPVSSRVRDDLHTIASDALDTAEVGNVPVHLVRVIS